MAALPSFLSRLIPNAARTPGAPRPAPEAAEAGFLPRNAITATALADDLAGRLPALLVAAERLARTVGQGSHARRKAGQGDEFWQYRPATQGEPASAIDWRQSARGDRAFVREREAQTPHIICIWCDNSASMRWHSDPALPPKAERAFLLALASAAMLLRQGERIRLLGTTPTTPPLRLHGHHALEQMAHALLAALRHAPDAPDLPLTTAIPARSRVLLFGDGLYPPAQLETFLRQLAMCQATTTLVEILDPAETTLPYTGPTRFTGVEEDMARLLHGSPTLQQDYALVWQRHQARLRTLCAAVGSPPVMHMTDQPPLAALMALHTLLEAGGRP
ncbi:hypothetical protein B0W47_04850 [Komagataeibacter nataicola]|uniref:DUF58 domain-containing protein n=1 Tax=Komagataeibacter nataicola TaxID=265960 RepID=A0A9N7CXG7_9PROT|nr:DUF58 domain-containing protein [Komagataeibacter nataicola]AQU86911.1 hypothetical protein B0W47_04850 [Komagataeibacter nataicola]WEQ56138.1 DUF58 domain-containing protein [Komagataeibacter nataicola]WNM07743.1 DUF58 domain-containing protein [Komagataeibacter nataicola]GBR23957.1 hypothetical protein AA0616_2629 [Komagataeibacter nataicola NRIC 0616]